MTSAGLRPRVVDIDPATLDYDPAALAGADCRRVLAIVATNLYGCPNDLPHLEAFARERDLLVVDDAAQAMGAAIGNRSSGTFGDAGQLHGCTTDADLHRPEQPVSHVVHCRSIRESRYFS